MSARVLVTRDEPAGGPLALALARHGLEPVAFPVVTEAAPLDPSPLARAAVDLERYDWLIVASRRAVENLMRARAGRALPKGLRTAAVGEATARALADHGATDVVTAREPGARALSQALASEPWRGRRVLLPRAEGGSDELATALRSAGAEVDEVIAYRTIERAPEDIAAAWPAVDPDGAIVASPSAARALVAAIGTARLARLTLVAIGPTTSAEIARLGCTAAVAGEATFEAAAALAEIRIRRNREGDHA